ncbi:hypothetical protein SGPA1_40454 [Streptomyces misionensis JCM 4497]
MSAHRMAERIGPGADAERTGALGRALSETAPLGRTLRRRSGRGGR